MKKTTLIDGFVIEEITPDFTEEEEEKALRTITEELICFGKSRKKTDKTRFKEKRKWEWIESWETYVNICFDRRKIH